MNFFKKLFKTKKEPATVTINVFGKDLIIDVSERALKKRSAEFEVIKKNSWTEIKDIEKLSNGRLFSKNQWCNSFEEQLTGFNGQMIFSQNKEYCVVFVDAINTEKGIVALVDVVSQKMLYKIDVERPHRCKVSNNGMVSCNDSNSRESKSTNFFVFDIDGKEYYKQRINGSVNDICLINNDGTYAAFDVQPQTELRVVDLINKKLIKTIPLDHNTMNDFSLEVDKVVLHFKDSSKKEIKL